MTRRWFLGLLAVLCSLFGCWGRPKRRIGVVTPPEPAHPALWAIYYPPGSVRIGFRTVDNRVLAESLLQTLPHGMNAAQFKIQMLNRDYHPDQPWKIVNIQCASQPSA